MKKMIFLLCMVFMMFSSISYSNNFKQVENTSEYTDELDRLRKLEENFKKEELEKKKLEEEIEKKDVRVIFKPTKKINFDNIADDYNNTIRRQLKNSGIKNLVIAISIILASIQLSWSLLVGFVTDDFMKMITNLYKNILRFGIYIFTVVIIFDERLIKGILKISYILVGTLTGMEKIVSLNELWDYSNLFIMDLFGAMGRAWYWDLWRPIATIKSFGNSLVLVLLLLILIIAILTAFFEMMFELFKMIISISVVLPLSTIFLPLGLTEVTKKYYSLNVVISIIINFVIKITVMNTFVLITMIVLKKYNISRILSNMAENGISIGEVFANTEFLSFIIIIWILVDLMKKDFVQF